MVTMAATHISFGISTRSVAGEPAAWALWLRPPLWSATVRAARCAHLPGKQGLRDEHCRDRE